MGAKRVEEAALDAALGLAVTGELGIDTLEDGIDAGGDTDADAGSFGH